MSPISAADFAPRRQTRAFAASLEAFAYNGDAPIQESPTKRVKCEDLSENDSSLSSSGSASAFDIEDLPFSASPNRKRKRGLGTPSTVVTTISTATSTRTSPRKSGMKDQDDAIGKKKKARRQPAKKIVKDNGE